MNNKYQGKSKPRGRENIPALQKAGDDAARMRESPDEDLAHAGQVIGRLADKLIAMRKEQRIKLETRNRRSRKRFYTSADASAIEDDD